LNLTQLKTQSPAFNTDLHIIKRTSGDIAMSGGNDYKFESDIDSVDRRYIKKNIFAYVKDDSIYLNCINFKLATWYALAITNGNFLAFNASMTNEKASDVVFMGGAIGGAIAASKRYLYVLSLRTGNVRPLKKEYIIARLKENKVLLNQFNSEKKKDSEKTLIKYINLLNETVSLNSAAQSH
jgi:hypothetical protein